MATGRSDPESHCPFVNVAVKSLIYSCLSHADGLGGLRGSSVGVLRQRPWLQTAVGLLRHQIARRMGAEVAVQRAEVSLFQLLVVFSPLLDDFETIFSPEI